MGVNGQFQSSGGELSYPELPPYEDRSNAQVA
jgi:hypothetical protein